MKKQIFTLFFILLLAVAIIGCSSTQDQTDTGVPAQETSAALVDTPTPESAEPAPLPTEEPVVVPTEETALGTVEPSETAVAQSDMATEEAAVAPTEQTDLMTEETATTEAMTATVEATTEPQAAVTTEPEEVLAPTGPTSINRLSNLVDFEVWNLNDEQVGEVDALIINQDTSQIEYVVVGVGGFLGLGEKEVPVPWQALQLNITPLGMVDTGTDTTTADTIEMTDMHENTFILDADQDRLEQAPDIDLDTIYEPQAGTLDNGANDQTQEETPSFYDREPEINSFWQSNFTQAANETNDTAQNADQMDNSTADTTMTTHLVLADDLLGATLVNSTGQADIMNEPDNNTADTDTDTADQPAAEATQEVPAADTQAVEPQDIGEIQDALVDTNTGKVTYLLASLNDLNPLPDTQEPVTAATAEPLTDTQTATTEGDQWVFIPLQAVSWDSENEVVVYTGSQSLEQAPAITEDDLDNGLAPTMITDADSFWGIDMSNPVSDTTQ